MVKTRRIGEKFTLYGTDYVVEAVENDKEPCKECCFYGTDGSCLARIGATGFCYKGFRKDERQVRFRKKTSFHEKCRGLDMGYDKTACLGTGCTKKYSCKRFMLGMKAKLMGYNHPVPFLENCEKKKYYLSYEKNERDYL